MNNNNKFEDSFKSEFQQLKELIERLEAIQSFIVLRKPTSDKDLKDLQDEVFEKTRLIQVASNRFNLFVYNYIENLKPKVPIVPVEEYDENFDEINDV